MHLAALFSENLELLNPHKEQQQNCGQTQLTCLLKSLKKPKYLTKKGTGGETHADSLDQRLDGKPSRVEYLLEVSLARVVLGVFRRRELGILQWKGQFESLVPSTLLVP